MNKILWLAAGISAALLYSIVSRNQGTSRASRPVDDLAHKLQDAWADHHTVA